MNSFIDLEQCIKSVLIFYSHYIIILPIKRLHFLIHQFVVSVFLIIFSSSTVSKGSNVITIKVRSSLASSFFYTQYLVETKPRLQ
jgi:hypothetical protein